MSCGLYKYKVWKITHYVGASGKEYDRDEYLNHGYGGVKLGYKDLPHHEYPYTMRTTEYPKYKCCRICNCKKD